MSWEGKSGTDLFFSNEVKLDLSQIFDPSDRYRVRAWRQVLKYRFFLSPPHLIN